MKLKKVFAALMTVMLLVSFAASAFAAGPVINIDIPQDRNEEFDVTVSISQNPGFFAFQMELDYDLSAYECVAIKAGSLTNNMLNASNTDTQRFICANSGLGGEVLGDGVLAVFTLRPLSGSSDITVSNVMMTDSSNNEIAFTIVGVALTEEPEEEQPEEQSEEEQTEEEQTEEPEQEEEQTSPQDPDNYKSCQRNINCPAYKFSDLDLKLWYHDGIHFCLENGLMNGVGNGKFDPNGKTTRAMMMTILARMDGCDTAGGITWYDIGMSWAKTNGISDGTNPGGYITREQFAAMIYRYAKMLGVDVNAVAENTNTLSYNDIFSVSSWASEGVNFCIASGIINGKGNGNIDPQGYLTRAEAAAMIQRFFEKYLTK